MQRDPHNLTKYNLKRLVELIKKNTMSSRVSALFLAYFDKYFRVCNALINALLIKYSENTKKLGVFLKIKREKREIFFF